MTSPVQRLQTLAATIATRMEFGWDDDNAVKVATAGGILGAASSYVRGGVENSANWSNKRRMVGALAGGLITGAGGYAVTKLLKNTKGKNGQPPPNKFAALADVIELGMRTIKSGPMAGQVARWGRHLPKTMPHGTMAPYGQTTGVLQIHDPATKASMTIERSRRAYAANPERWVGGREAYIANIQIPKKYRPRTGRDGKLLNPAEAMTGGRSLAKLNKGVFDHYDGKRVLGGQDVVLKGRQVRTSTIAGAYEGKTVAEKAAGTHGLVHSYQKQRGYKIDTQGQGLANDYNVAMRRRPGAAKARRPLSEGAYGRYMARLRTASSNTSKAQLRENMRPMLAPAATLAGAGAVAGGTAIAARHDNEPAKKALVPGMIAGALVGGGAAARLGGHLRDTGRNTLDHLAGLGQVARVDLGKAIARRSGRGSQWVARRLLTGLV